MTPFERFFAEDFKRKLDTIQNERGVAAFDLTDASWDRKAAFLLWVALGRPKADKPKKTKPVDDEDFMDLV